MIILTRAIHPRASSRRRRKSPNDPYFLITARPPSSLSTTERIPITLTLQVCFCVLPVFDRINQPVRNADSFWMKSSENYSCKLSRRNANQPLKYVRISWLLYSIWQVIRCSVCIFRFLTIARRHECLNVFVILPLVHLATVVTSWGLF